MHFLQYFYFQKFNLNQIKLLYFYFIKAGITWTAEAKEEFKYLINEDGLLVTSVLYNESTKKYIIDVFNKTK